MLESVSVSLCFNQDVIMSPNPVITTFHRDTKYIRILMMSIIERPDMGDEMNNKITHSGKQKELLFKLGCSQAH